jgi:hypothetical protein
LSLFKNKPVKTTQIPNGNLPMFVILLACYGLASQAAHSFLSKDEKTIVGSFLNPIGASKMRGIHASMRAEIYKDRTPDDVWTHARILQHAETQEFTLWSTDSKMTNLCKNVEENDWDEYCRATKRIHKNCECALYYFCENCSLRNSLLLFFVENAEIKKKTLERLFVSAGIDSDIDLAEILLRKGVNVNCTRQGLTALYFSDVAQYEFCKFLLENGANANFEENLDVSPFTKFVEFHLLIPNMNDEELSRVLRMFELFLEHGADPHVGYEKSESVMDLIEDAIDVSEFAKAAAELLKIRNDIKKRNSQ